MPRHNLYKQLFKNASTLIENYHHHSSYMHTETCRYYILNHAYIFSGTTFTVDDFNSLATRRSLALCSFSSLNFRSYIHN